MLLVAVAGGVFLGLCLGLLGGGGSLLALPILVYLVDQTPVAASMGALLIVGISALTGAVAAGRRGNVKVGRSLTFAGIGTAGAVAGTALSVRVAADVLLVSFSALMLVVAFVMWLRQSRTPATTAATAAEIADAPILVLRAGFRCDCPRALRVVLAALVVGAITGFFGVGGGFLVVPALVVALDLDMHDAVGSSLLVIAVNSAVAFVARLGHGVEVAWSPVLLLTGAAVAGSLAGVRLAPRLNPRLLGSAFVLLLLTVATFTAVDSVAALRA